MKIFDTSPPPPQKKKEKKKKKKSVGYTLLHEATMTYLMHM